MSGDQMPSLLGRERRQMPVVCPGGGGIFKVAQDLAFDG